MTCFDRLRDRIRTTEGILSVGLNPEPSRIPADCREYDYPRRAFNRRMIDATSDHAAAYTANLASYETPRGWVALAETLAYAEGQGVPVVLDGKRADFTANRHADLLDRADAVTVSPFLGRDALAPVLDREMGAFVVCRTPNSGAADLQDAELADGAGRAVEASGVDGTAAATPPAGSDAGSDGEDEEAEDGESLAERAASLAAEWAAESTADVGLLVGGDPDDLEALRERAPDLPFLVVGGARNDPAVAEYATADGVGLVDASREVIYAGEAAGRDRERGADAYASAARQAAGRLKHQLNRHRATD